MQGTTSRFLLAGFLCAFPSLATGQCLQWDTQFTAQNALHGEVYAMTVFDDGTGRALYVGGDFFLVGGTSAHAIARWDGSSWSTLGSGLDLGPGGYRAGVVGSLAVYDDGSGPALYAVGRFTYAGGLPARFIAKWDGTAWSPLGAGLGFDAVYSLGTLAVFDDGTGAALYVAGSFATAGGLPVQHIAKWDGSTWSPVGSGLAQEPYSLATFDDGSGAALFAGGDSAVHRWDGSSWSEIAGGVTGDVFALTVFDAGSGRALLAGGGRPYPYLDGGVSAWDGSSWSPLGGAMDAEVRALASFDDGNGLALYAGGDFETAGGVEVHHVAKWGGAAWTPLGAGANGEVEALTTFDDGSGAGPALYAGGDFRTAGAVEALFLSAWKGCSDPIDTLCFGDGSVAACACATGQTGRGCANSSQSAGAVLAVGGATAPDTIRLQVAGEPARALTFFLQGDAVVTGTAFSGAGLRCVGGTIKRLYVRSASGGSVVAPGPGDPSITARSAALGDPIVSGSVRYYQALYREPNTEFCPFEGNWNLTNGARIRW